MRGCRASAARFSLDESNLKRILNRRTGRVGLILPSDKRRSLSTSRFQVLWIDIFPTPANHVLQAGQDAQIGSKMLAISASRFLPLASVWLTK
jgi:hypothetical protein